MIYTYVLLSKKDGEFYVGFAKDLKQRLDFLKHANLDCYYV